MGFAQGPVYAGFGSLGTAASPVSARLPRIDTRQVRVKSRTTNSSEEEAADPRPIARVVEDERFNMFVGVVILLNTFCMALETNYPDWWIGWTIVNNAFLLFFVLEIAARINTYGRAFFCDCENNDWGWNIFDFTVVFLSVMDYWVNDLILAIVFRGGDKTNPLDRYVMLLRIFRVLRILRVFKNFPELMKLVVGIMESLELVVWIAILMFMFMFVMAIFITTTVGNHADDFDDPDMIRKYWGGVWCSWKTLFQFMTLDDWSAITRQVASQRGYGYMWVLFDVYVFAAAFAMLSLLTGVIADHMSEVSTKEKKQESLKQEKEIGYFVEELRRDSPSDTVDKPVFKAIFVNEDGRPTKAAMQLEDLGVSLEPSELDQCWDYLDRNMCGNLSWDDFSAGLLRHRGDVTSKEMINCKDMLRMRCAAERVSRRLSFGLGSAGSRRKLNEVVRDMDDVNTSLQRMGRHMAGFISHMERHRA